MPAPLGNQFWKLRSRHGRDKLFATPELLWEAVTEYFETCDDNPFYKKEAKTVNIGDFQSKVEIAEIPTMRPYTIQGLCRYLNCNTVWFNQFEKNLKAEDEGFSQILIRIRDIIYEQKYSGAASGFFNASIIARDLNLVDKKEVEKKVTTLQFKDAE